MCAKFVNFLPAFVVFLAAIVSQRYVDSFNVDVRHALLYSNEVGSLFGYSVQLMRNSEGKYLLLAGAPAGNSSYDSSFQPGVVYSCRIDNDQCRELYYSHSDDLITDPNFNYVELRNGSWLGVAIDVANDESQFVACGHLWKNMIHFQEYLVNGICYVHNADLTIGAVHVLMPLINHQFQVYDRQYIYALGMAGMSVHFASDAANLLIGAPGVQQLAGSVISLPLQSLEPRRGRRAKLNYNIPVPNDKMSEDSYFGYAITSGRFYSDKVVYYVAGAPRQGVNGMAFIYQMGEFQNDQVAIKNIVGGTQMGEYFGSSLCAVDVNNDGLVDLLVGAPFHSFEGDEGSVYVYISYGNFIQVSNDLLTGSKVPGARFGTAIAAVGDLNLDGYQDVAIGAPYEGNGAVYVYHGGVKGLGPNEAQKILAAEVNPGLRGFGISISKGRDIDGNAYPDFAVGAHASANAVVLRTRPIILVAGSLSLDLNRINPKNKTCEEGGGRMVSCFTLEVCTSYTGKHLPSAADVEVFVENDVYKKDDFQSSRVYFFDPAQGQMENLNFVASLTKFKPDCRRYSVHVKETIFDFLSPVEFRLSLKLKEDLSRKTFCKDCPVIDALAPSNITTQVSFLTGCKDVRCIADLKLKADFVGYSPGDVMVLGEKDILQLLVEVNNVGDLAFQTVLRIIFPPKIDFSRIPSACSSYMEDVSVALFCNLGNPLEANTPIVLQIGADVKKLDSDTKELTFNFSVTTVSDETDESKADNVFLLSLPVKSVADVSVKGWQVNEEAVFYNRSNPDAVSLTHIFEINKYEASPIKDVTLDIRFPISNKNQTSFFYKPIKVEVFYNYVPVNSKCEPKVTSPSSTVVQHIDTEYGTTAVLDCTSMMCHVVRCHVGPFLRPKDDVSTVNITAVVDLPVLIALAGSTKVFQLRSSVLAQISDKHVVRPQSGRPIEATLITTFIPQDLTPQGSLLPGWVIPLAIIFGLLLLAAIAYVMYRFGFFRRKIKEDMMHSGLTEAAVSTESLHEADANN